MKYIIETSVDMKINDETDGLYVQALVRPKGDHLEWTFKSKREAEKAMHILIKAGFTAVRRKAHE